MNKRRFSGRRTGFQPVCLQKTGWKPVLLISRSMLSNSGARLSLVDRVTDDAAERFKDELIVASISFLNGIQRLRGRQEIRPKTGLTASFSSRNRRWRLVLLGALAIAVLVIGNVLRACPFCLSPPMTLAQEIDNSEFVVIVELLRFEVLNNGTREVPRSTVRIREFLQGSELVAGCDRLRPGRAIAVKQEVAGSPGELFLLFGELRSTGSTTQTTFASDTSVEQPGSPGDEGVVTAGLPVANSGKSSIQRISFVIPELISWSSHTPVSPTAIRYIKNSPPRSLSATERLPYFMTFLENPDPLLSIDAWSEIAHSTYDDVKSVRSALPRDKLRQWIADPEMSPERLGLYGMMLGLCGDADDAEFLKSQIGIEPPSSKENAPTFRYGTEGLMGGYLLLTGEEGVTFLEQSRLNSDVPIDSSHAAMQAIQFVWSYESQLIPPQHLKSAMRRMLSSDALRIITIANLARWNDWECWPELERLFKNEAAADHATQKAIVLFAEECRKATNADGSALIQAEDASKFLAEAEQQHPELFRSTYNDVFNSPN